jgi:hypothetical protein
LATRQFRRDRDEGVESRLQSLDLGEMRLEQFHSADFASIE